MDPKTRNNTQAAESFYYTTVSNVDGASDLADLMRLPRRVVEHGEGAPVKAGGRGGGRLQSFALGVGGHGRCKFTRGQQLGREPGEGGRTEEYQVAHAPEFPSERREHFDN